jgi:hypothetical protein
MRANDKLWRRFLAVCALGGAVACSSSDDNGTANTPVPDAGTNPDNNPGGNNPASGGCTLPNTLEFNGPLPPDGTPASSPMYPKATLLPVDPANAAGAKRLTLLLRLVAPGETGTEAVGDYLAISLVEGRGPFAGGFVAGTYQFTGDNADGNKCAACVFLFGDANLMQQTAAQEYVAGGGSLTISAVNATPTTGTFNGTLSNVTLRQVTVNNGVQADVPSGCTSTIPTLQFSSTPTAPAAASLQDQLLQLGSHKLPVAPSLTPALDVVDTAPVH